MGALFVQLAFSITDTFWVGRTLGPEALAAVSTAGFYVWMVLSLGEGLSVGLNAVAARRHGAGETDLAVDAASTALRLAVASGLALAALSLWIVPRVLGLMLVPATVRTLGVQFLATYAIGIPMVFVSFVIESAFRASGDTKTPLYLLSGAAALNVVLDPLLILGLGPFPALGIRGAATATIITRTGLCVVGVLLLHARGLVRLPRYDRAAAPAILKIGFPAAANGVLFSVVYMSLTRVTAQFGTPALAALGVGHKIEGVAYFIGVGFSMAAGAIVGQNLGAEQLARARRAGWVSTGYAVLAASAVAAVYLAVPETLMRAFTGNAAVVRDGALYLRIIAPSQIGQGVEVVLAGALGGAGFTVWPSIAAATLTAARLPLAWALAPAWGLAGIWWTISATSIARGVVMGLLWRFARWERNVV